MRQLFCKLYSKYMFNNNVIFLLPKEDPYRAQQIAEERVNSIQ
jgi:hypothetical protein